MKRGRMEKGLKKGLETVSHECNGRIQPQQIQLGMGLSY
jgi:hypothetical protein